MKLYPDIEELKDYDYPVEMEDLCREPGEKQLYCSGSH